MRSLLNVAVLVVWSAGVPLAAQRRVPEPHVTAEQRAWLEVRCGTSLERIFRGEEESAFGAQEFEDEVEMQRFGVLFERAALAALWGEDPSQHLGAAVRLSQGSPMLQRDARRVARMLLPWTIGAAPRCSPDVVSCYLDADTVAEAIALLPKTAEPRALLGHWHRSMAPRHLPALLDATRDPRIVPEDDSQAWSALLATSTALQHADPVWYRYLGRWLLAQGRVRPSIEIAAPQAGRDGLAAEVASLLADPRVVADPEWRRALTMLVLVDEAGSADVELARQLVATEVTADEPAASRRLALRIFADAGHRPALARHVDDPDEATRCLAHLGLAKLGDPTAAATLAAAPDLVVGPGLAWAEVDPGSWARAFCERALADWHTATRWWSPPVLPDTGLAFEQLTRLRHDLVGAALARQAIDLDLPPALLLHLAARWPEARSAELAEVTFTRLEASPVKWSALGPQGPGALDCFEVPEFDLLELHDPQRLRRLLRSWLALGDEPLRAVAVNVLLPLGDPASAAALVDAFRRLAGPREQAASEEQNSLLWEMGYWDRAGGSPWIEFPVMVLARTRAPAVLEYLLHRSRADGAESESDDYEWESTWQALALYGGVSPRDADLSSWAWPRRDEAEGFLSASPRAAQLLRELRPVDAYLESLRALPENTDFSLIPATRMRDPRILAVVRERYDAGFATAFDLARFDPDHWAQCVDDALHTGFYGYFNGSHGDPDRDLDLFRDPERLAALLDLTEANCCTMAYVRGVLDATVDPSFDEPDSWWGRPDLPILRARLRRMLPRLRWSVLVQRLVAGPE